MAKSKLTLLHVSTDATSQWSDFPGVRETLERWGVLPEGSPKSAVAELGIAASKVVANEGAPVEAVLRYLEKHPTDLIVLATSQRGSHVPSATPLLTVPVGSRASRFLS